MINIEQQNHKRGDRGEASQLEEDCAAAFVSR